MIKRLLRAGVIFTVSIICISITACSSDNLCNSTEKSRLTSPDNIVDVVIVEKDCGATTSTSILVFIVPNKSNVTEFSPVLVADKVDDLVVNWDQSKKLLIKYSDARIFDYTNFWSSKEVERFGYKVDIALIQRPIRTIPADAN